MQIGALKILRELCTSKRVCVTLKQFGGIMSLIDLLQYTDKLVQGIAAEVISQLSRLSAVRRTLRVSQGIKRLVSITTTSSSSAPLITNVQSNLAKGRIADSSPFPTVNGFVRY